ncbi:MAG: hypothetical protein AMS18_09450 [Gemmatimonas sp. SG8_17]|nr:MAG: hypothetical protein AMS18_09450 [Gemmatimonas sp. SG8_17]
MRLSVATMVGGALIALSSCSQGPAPFSETDVVAIRQIERDFAQAALYGDWDRMVAYFAEDAIRMPFNAPPEQGRDQIREHFNVVDSITQWTIHESHVDGDGSLAYLRQSYTVTGFMNGMTAGVTYTGKSLAVLRRQPDGRWLFVVDIWNADAPFSMPD